MRHYIRCLFVVLLVSCFSASAYEGPLFIVGSTTISKLVGVIEKPFYEKTGIRLVVRPTGSKKGLISIGEGVSDLGVVSRYLTDKELEKWPNLVQHTVGQDAIVFLLHQSNPVEDVSYEQVRDIYSGSVTEWSAIKDTYTQPVVALSKAKGHATHDSFQEFFELSSLGDASGRGLLFKKKGISHLFSKHPTQLFNQVNQAVGVVSRTPNAIAYESLGGYMTFSQTSEQSLASTAQIKILSLDGVAPLQGQTVNHKYPFVRPLNVVTQKSPKPSVKALIEFLLSDECQRLIQQSYFIPLNQYYSQVRSDD